MPEVKLEGSCQFTLMGSYQDFISVYALVGWDPSTEEAPAEAAAAAVAVPAGTQVQFSGGYVKLYIAEGKDISIEFPV